MLVLGIFGTTFYQILTHAHVVPISGWVQLAAGGPQLVGWLDGANGTNGAHGARHQWSFGLVDSVDTEAIASCAAWRSATGQRCHETWLRNPLKSSIWVNYNDLTATSLESWLIRGIISKWPYFRLVKYYNLPRIYNIYIYTNLCVYSWENHQLKRWIFQQTTFDLPESNIRKGRGTRSPCKAMGKNHTGWRVRSQIPSGKQT